MAPSLGRNRKTGFLGYTSHIGETHVSEAQMGWYSENYRSRKDLVKKLTKGKALATPGGLVARYICLAHCYRGCIFSGILWSVWEQKVTKDGIHVKPIQRWIRCNLLRHRTSWGWSVKTMDEIAGPFFYSCPLRYLEMAPVVDRHWRACVREYHRRLKARRAGTSSPSTSISRSMRQPMIAYTSGGARKRSRAALPRSGDGS